MLHAKQSAIEVASYEYNGLGQRTSKTLADGTAIQFVYGLQGELLAERDESGTVLAEYLYLNGRLLAMLQGGQVYYVHTDHLGTPSKLTNSTGTVVWTASYDPFGAATVNEDPDGDSQTITLNVRFPGQYYDSETGLHYNYFRYYDPSTGRYITSDPIGLLGGPNTYLYANGNPLRFADLYGLDAQEIFEDLWDAGPFDTYQGYQDAQDAMSNSRATGLPGPHNGRQDAYRHCLWSCLMASNINQQDAKEIGDNHEEAGNRSGQPANESAMDQFNNNVGRSCATQPPRNDPKSCPSKCMNKLTGGNLQTSP